MKHDMNDGSDGGVNRWLWMAPVLAALISGVLSWYISYTTLGITVAKNETELAQRLLTRFSQDDALQLEQRIDAEIRRLDERIDLLGPVKSSRPGRLKPVL